MRLDHIKYFLKVAEIGTISGASERLYISQQALSTALKRLENELGVTLLDRSTHGVKLTHDGEYLKEEFLKIQDSLDRILTHFSSSRNENITLKIGTISVVEKWYLARSISWFYKYLPYVNLDISVMNPDDIIKGIAMGNYDLGFISLLNTDQSLNCFDENFEFTPIERLPFSIIMHKDHPLGKQRTISLEELCDYPAILLEAGDIDSYLPNRIFQYYKIKNVIWASNETLFTQMLEDNLGYSLYTQIQFGGNPITNTVNLPLTQHPLKESLYATIGYINLKENDKKECIDQFCAHL